MTKVGFGSTRLGLGEAGQDGSAARSDMLREDGREIVQGALEQVGEHEVGLHAVEEGMRKSSRHKHPDQGPDAVLPRIVGCDRCRQRIAVACHHASPERLGGGDGEDAGAGADIDDDARAAALELIVERQETAARAGMMRRAESLAGVDLNGKTSARYMAPVVTAMHEKAPGLDLSAPLLRERDPIFRGEFFDAERPDTVAAGSLRDQLKQSIVARRLLVMGEDLEAALSPIEQPDRDRRRVERLIKSTRDTLRRQSLGLDDSLMDHGAELRPAPRSQSIGAWRVNLTFLQREGEFSREQSSIG